MSQKKKWFVGYGLKYIDTKTKKIFIEANGKYYLDQKALEELKKKSASP
jgi:hypothetical protein